MAVERQTSVVETQSKITGFPESIQGARALDAAFTGVSESSKNISGAVIDVAAQIDRLDSKYDASIKTANEVARVQGLIAAARAQGGQDEEQYARVLSASLAAHEAALNKVAGAANDNTAATSRMASAGRDAADALQQQTTAMQALANAFARVKPSEIDTGRAADVRAYSDALDELGAKFNPMVAAEQKLARETAELNTAFANFEINILDLERGLERANATFQKSAAAVRNYYTEIEKAAAKAAAASQQKINTQLFGTPKRADDEGMQKRQDDLNAYGEELDNLRARVSPLYAAEREFAKAVKEADLALAAQLVTGKEHEAQLKRLKTAYDNTVSSIHGAGNAATSTSKNFGLASHQIQNLGFQLNDLVVQIGSGGGIFRPLLQQGAQIQQILSMSEGGVGGVLQRVTASIKEIGPATVATRVITVGSFAAIAASIGTAIAAAVEFQEQQVQIQRALKGGGRGAMAGLQERDIQSAASAASAAGEISTANARAAAIEIARTGKIGREVLTGLTKQTYDYARVLGIETVDAAKKLGAAFADPAKGAAALAEELNFLSAAQVEEVAAMARSGNMLSAQTRLMTALEREVANNKITIDTFAKAWELAGNVVKNAADKMVQAAGRALAPPTTEQLLENLQRGAAEPDTAKQTRRRAAAQGPTATTDTEALAKELAQLELRARLANEAAAAEEKRLNLISRIASATTAALDPTIAKFKELSDQATKLQAGLEQPQRLENWQATADALERVKDQMSGATSAYGMHTAAIERQAEANRLALAALQATSQEERAGIAAAQAALALKGQGTTQIQRDTAARQAALQVITAANVEADREIAVGQQQAAMQQAQLEVQLAENEVDRQAAVLRQAKLAEEQTLLNLLDKGVAPRRAIALAEQQYAAVLAQESAARAQAIQQADRQIAQGKLEIAAINATTVAQRAAVAAAQMELSLLNSLIPQKQKDALVEQARAKVYAQSEASLRSMIQAQESELRLINAQIGAVGMEEKARASLLAGIRAENELIAQGIDLRSRLAQEYIANAKALATATERLREAEEAQKRLDNATKNLAYSWAGLRPAIDAAGNALAQYSRNAASATQANNSLASSATKITKSIIPIENTMQGLLDATPGGGTFLRPGTGLYTGETIGQAEQRLVDQEYGKYLARGESEERAMYHAREFVKSRYQGSWLGIGGGLNFKKNEEWQAVLNAEAAAAKSNTSATDNFSSSADDFESAADDFSSATDNFSSAVDTLDIGSLMSPIGDEIDQLRDLQEAALSRVYKPDPYMEKNPEYFYTGDKIMKAGQDRIFDGLQVQIEKLQGLQAALGTLVNQNAALPQTLVDALIAAGFANIAQQIVSAFNSMNPLSATPNPTAVLADNGSFWRGVNRI